MKKISCLLVLLAACGGTATEPTTSEVEEIGSPAHVCVQTTLCIEGDVWSPKSCSCVPEKGGVKCGSKTCGAKEYCCNASCGICASVGLACIQIACVSQ